MLKPLKNGLGTGLLLQLALGPVFFYIANLTLNKSISDALAGVLAVTTVDFVYMCLAISGIASSFRSAKLKNILEFIGPLILIIFGILMFSTLPATGVSITTIFANNSLIQSFVSVAIITATNFLTIIFFTGLFTTKAIENGYTNKDSFIFGFGTILSTLIFMTCAVLVFSMFKSAIHIPFTNYLSKIVAIIIFGYGVNRLKSAIINKLPKR